MDRLRIDIINPKAKKLLKDLEDLNLIPIKKMVKSDLKRLLPSLEVKLIRRLPLMK